MLLWINSKTKSKIVNVDENEHIQCDLLCDDYIMFKHEKKTVKKEKRQHCQKIIFVSFHDLDDFFHHSFCFFFAFFLSRKTFYFFRNFMHFRLRHESFCIRKHHFHDVKITHVSKSSNDKKYDSIIIIEFQEFQDKKDIFLFSRAWTLNESFFKRSKTKNDNFKNICDYFLFISSLIVILDLFCHCHCS